MHEACLRGDVDLLASLYSNGDEFGREFDIDAPDGLDGNSPLHIAAAGGHIACVRLLCESAANTKAVNARGDGSASCCS